MSQAPLDCDRAEMGHVSRLTIPILRRRPHDPPQDRADRFEDGDDQRAQRERAEVEGDGSEEGLDRWVRRLNDQPKLRPIQSRLKRDVPGDKGPLTVRPFCLGP